MRSIVCGACALFAAAAGCGSVESAAVDGGPGDDGPAGDADPGRRRGVDYSWDRPSPQGLRDAGYTFAVRYLSYSTTGKNVTAPEASALIAAGLDVVANWEFGASDVLEGRDRGASDAAEALRQAVEVGVPGDRPIYFAVDFDASADQQPVIDAYFDGVASVLGVARTGAYAGFGPLQRLFDGGKIAFGWQTYAWSGGRWDPRAQLRQVRNSVVIAGGECDIDEAWADDFGQWGAAR